MTLSRLVERAADKQRFQSIEDDIEFALMEDGAE